MQQQKPYVITIVGPESSGKTTLARELAAHFDCPWVPEYARTYLEGLERDYDVEDLTMIAEGQLAALQAQLEVKSEQFSTTSLQSLFSEFLSKKFNSNSQTNEPQDLFARKTDYADYLPGKLFLEVYREDFGDQPRPLVIVDSGMLSLRLWARIKYGITLPIVEEALKKDVTSMYILCRPVHPWEPDPFREAPSLLERAWIYNHFLREVLVNQSK